MKKLILLTILAWSAVAYSAQPITFIVPAPAGSTSDTIVRKIAQQLETKTKQSVVVDNAPGGDQLIGLAKFNNSTTPTLILGGTTLHVFTPVFKPQHIPEIENNTDMIAMVAYGPAVWYTNPQTGIKTGTELVNFLKTNKKINIGSDLIATRINAEVFRKDYNLDNVSVIQYKSSIQTVTDVTAGNLEIGLSTPTPALIGLIQEGKIIPLATTSKKSVTLGNKQIQPMSKFAPVAQWNSGWFISTSKSNPVSAETVSALHEILQSNETKKMAEDLGIVYDYLPRKESLVFIDNYRNQIRGMVGFVNP